MSTEQEGGAERKGVAEAGEGAPPQPSAEAPQARPRPVDVAAAEAADEAGEDDLVAAGDVGDADPAVADDAGEDDLAVAAGGVVLGESPVVGHADPSRLRRAPKYKRFVLLGVIVGVLIAAIAAGFAIETEYLDRWGLFLLLTTILVPVMILVSCAVAVFTDRGARVSSRTRARGPRQKQRGGQR